MVRVQERILAAPLLLLGTVGLESLRYAWPELILAGTVVPLPAAAMAITIHNSVLVGVLMLGTFTRCCL